MNLFAPDVDTRLRYCGVYYVISCSGIVGETEDGQDGKEYYLWTHRRLDIGWNGNQVRNPPSVGKPPWRTVTTRYPRNSLSSY